jgi:glycosyltransferase involved in cell wall biosynthesis
MAGADISMSERLPRASVIVPAYNAGRWIRRCLESILASSYPRGRFEVICVDNSSTDRTAEILRDFRSEITVLQEKKPGAAAARNAGLQVASGPMIAFTDADCIADPDWLREIVKPVWASRADAAGGRIMARPEARSVELFGELVHDHAKAIQHHRPPYLITMNMSVRLDMLKVIGYFDERWMRGQDADLSCRILAAGGSFAYAPEAVIRHHHRDTLAALAREGFLHGYMRPQFERVHGEFVRSYRDRHGRCAPAHPVEDSRAAAELKPWQVAIYQSIFNAGKTLGEWKGRWFQPREFRPEENA